METWKRVSLWLLFIALAVGYGILLWRGPWIFDGAHLRSSNLQPADGVVITGVRTALVALGAGVIAGIGLSYTHRNHKLSQQQFKHTQEQFELAQQQFAHTQEQFRHEQQKTRDADELARESQVTERYVAAVKLLASTKMTERLGGIYALERILHDSPKDADAIYKVLATFSREQEWEADTARSSKTGGGTLAAPWEKGTALDDDVAAAQWVIQQRYVGDPDPTAP
ncbi:hypothetical protein [Streptomyces sp. NPDC024089]|uniref:hypothetical protein n=1 Tax=Streptomyces sp. NPDC024089 TaxID=3154328 RepID=UPI00340015BF